LYISFIDNQRVVVSTTAVDWQAQQDRSQLSRRLRRSLQQLLFRRRLRHRRTFYLQRLWPSLVLYQGNLLLLLITKFFSLLTIR
jgi:hypothetical protein